MDKGMKIRLGQSGIATIEFAIVVPILLLLMLATAELGQAFYTYNTLTKAIRDGARYLSVESNNGADAIDVTSSDVTATRNMVVFGNTAGTGPAVLNGLSPGQITAEQADPDHVRVAADFPYAPLFLSGIPTFGNGNIVVQFDMQPEAIMRAPL